MVPDLRRSEHQIHLQMLLFPMRPEGRADREKCVLLRRNTQDKIPQILLERLKIGSFSTSHPQQGASTANHSVSCRDQAVGQGGVEFSAETRSFMTFLKTSITSESPRNAEGKRELATPQGASWIRCDVHLMKCWNVTVPTCKELLAGLDLKEPRSVQRCSLIVVLHVWL